MSVPFQVRSPRVLQASHYVVNRHPIADGLNLFAFEDSDVEALPRESSQTAGDLVIRLAKSGPFGDQASVTIAEVIYDHPYWEVFVQLDGERFKEERLKRKARLAEVMSNFNSHLKRLAGCPTYGMSYYFPVLGRMKFAKTHTHKSVEVERIAGHVKNEVTNWCPSNTDRLAVAVASVLGGCMTWEKPVELASVGGMYWVKSGFTKVAALKLLGFRKIPYARVGKYVGVNRQTKGVFPKRKYWRT